MDISIGFRHLAFQCNQIKNDNMQFVSLEMSRDERNECKEY